jgi:hypothetical protein
MAAEYELNIDNILSQLNKEPPSKFPSFSQSHIYQEDVIIEEKSVKDSCENKISGSLIFKDDVCNFDDRDFQLSDHNEDSESQKVTMLEELLDIEKNKSTKDELRIKEL